MVFLPLIPSRLIPLYHPTKSSFSFFPSDCLIAVCILTKRHLSHNKKNKKQIRIRQINT